MVGTLQTLAKWNYMGMTFSRRSLNSKFWEPLGRAFNIRGNGISGGKGWSINPSWQLAFSHDFSSSAYLSRQFSFSFVLQFLSYVHTYILNDGKKKITCKCRLGRVFILNSAVPLHQLLLLCLHVGCWGGGGEENEAWGVKMGSCFYPAFYWLGFSGMRNPQP